MSNHCECHPWTDEDEKVWRKAKQEPRTEEEWKHLHDAIEGYRRLIIENYKRGLTSRREEEAIKGCIETKDVQIVETPRAVIVGDTGR